MTMPIDLVLVRHGESEGNYANKISRDGDHTLFTEAFKNRHSASWRLTDRGIEQAKMAGDWIRKNIGGVFGRYYTSEFVRAMETAALLNLPAAVWYREFFLSERSIGALDGISQAERLCKFSEEVERQKREGFFHAPPGGESMRDVCLRIYRILATLHRECTDKKVIMVCHGEVMWALRITLERIPLNVYRELDKSDNPFDRIHNCQIIHYTRRDPVTQEMAGQMNWVRSICPTNLKLSRNEWQYIERPRFSNEELLLEVNKTSRLISGA